MKRLLLYIVTLASLCRLYEGRHAFHRSSLLHQQFNHHQSKLTDARPRKKWDATELTKCVDYDTDFSVETDGWVPFDSDGDTFRQGSDGMQLNLVAPNEFIRLVEDGTNLPYNHQAAKGVTFSSEFYMLYGRVSARIKASRVGGSITAFILMSDTGDEIDFEFLGGDANQVQTNYFYAGEELYTVNGGLHPVPGAAVFDDFHTYTIDWSPERIQWFVDDQLIRVREKAQTCQADGVCKYPSSPSRIQYGLWDSSSDAGTAQWARGPIDWSVPDQKATANMRHISVTCNPDYNDVYYYDY